jgi:hypothetical protein
MHVVPNAQRHISFGFGEIIETVRFGLQSLGYEATYAINQFRPDSVNIVFGSQMLGIYNLERLPADTIVYNLEQVAGFAGNEINERMRFCAERFVIWDYSEFNLPAWRTLNLRAPVVHVPIGYAPILTRIEPSPEQDIDVLFYGVPGGKRLWVFAEICRALLRAVFLHGLYGAARDELIARSKIVLNVNQYPRSRLFEIARVSYLFANRKAIVSDFSADTKIEDDVRQAARLVPVEAIAQECVDLIAHPDQRRALEEAGFECMRRRDIRAILGRVL